MKKIWIIVFVFFAGTTLVNAAQISKEVTLKSCIDGDTANFIIDEKEIKVRFLALNTPEYEKEEYGKEASEYTCKLLKEAKTITVEYDEKATKDKYDRVLAWVWVDKDLLQEKVIANGYGEVAYVYDKYKYADSLCLVQQDAIKDKKNIWSNDNKEQDYCGGVDTTNIINIIDYDLQMSITEQSNYNQEDVQKIIDQIQNAQSKVEAINNATSKVGQFLDDNKEGVANVMLYALLGIAGIYVLLKTIKDLK